MLYPNLIRPILFQLDAETAHELTFKLALSLQDHPALCQMLSHWLAPQDAPQLHQQFWGQTFQNPIGLAAGFDKNVKLPKLMKALGFGFEEVGSISALPAQGNPRPRLFRLPKDQAIINRMGLNNEGAKALVTRLQALPTDWPVGISLVKTHHPGILGEAAIDDFCQALQGAYGLGTYICLNISCPNTTEGKTFEEPEALAALLAKLRETEAQCQSQNDTPPKPWLLKIAPDLASNQLQEMVEIAHRFNIAGWVATNTSPKREGLKTNRQRLQAIGNGGLSGQPIQQASTRILGELYQALGNHPTQQVLIGVGGIQDTESAWEKISHGASLIQIYTGLIYQGPGLIREIAHGLVRKLESHGLDSISQAVGLAYR